LAQPFNDYTAAVGIVCGFALAVSKLAQSIKQFIVANNVIQLACGVLCVHTTW
jgi:hypothetical protein